MADNGFGVSFMPNGDQLYKRPGDPQGFAGRAPVQDPIKVLQMRVPRVVGANPLAPLSLMGGRGQLPEGLLEQLLRTLGAGPRMQAAAIADQKCNGPRGQAARLRPPRPAGGWRR
jgi:hypothetical protein